MTTDVRMSVTLTPIGTPFVSISVAGIKKDIQLLSTTSFDFEFSSSNLIETLEINHTNKSATDSSTAVIIDRIEFFGIADPKFIWQGVYYPEYPEPWYSEQTVKPLSALPAQTYLGWNGVYRLEFGIPVFTWMHQVQDLGWIYQ